MKNKFTYYLGNVMYINVTNLCTNKCEFCIKSSGDSVGGVNLLLENENFSHKEIIEEIKANLSPDCKEVVFCGYGEPFIKLDIIKNTAKFIKENYPDVVIRVNTNGHGNLIHKKNIVPEIAGLIDQVSVSLNAQDADLYAEICHPVYDKETAYQAVKDFIEQCSKNGIDTTATVVSGFGDYKIDIEKCRKTAENLGAQFRVREWLPKGYDS